MDIQSRQPQQFLTKASGYLKDYTHTLNPYMAVNLRALTVTYVAHRFRSFQVKLGAIGSLLKQMNS